MQTIGYDTMFNCAYCDECTTKMHSGELPCHFGGKEDIVRIPIEELKIKWVNERQAHCTHCDKILY